MSFTTQLNERVSKALWFNVRSNPKSDAQVWRSDERQSCGQVKARHCNAWHWIMCLKLLRTLVVAVSMCLAIHCYKSCMSWFIFCRCMGSHGESVWRALLIVRSKAKSGLSGSSEKLGGLFLDFFMVQRWAVKFVLSSMIYIYKYKHHVIYFII